MACSLFQHASSDDHPRVDVLTVSPHFCISLLTPFGLRVLCDGLGIISKSPGCCSHRMIQRTTMRILLCSRISETAYPTDGLPCTEGPTFSPHSELECPFYWISRAIRIPCPREDTAPAMHNTRHRDFSTSHPRIHLPGGLSKFDFLSTPSNGERYRLVCIRAPVF